MSINDGLQENQIEMLEILAILANVFQVQNYMMNIKEISNDELMKALELQNSKYLSQILENQNKLLEKLNRIFPEDLDKN